MMFFIYGGHLAHLARTYFCCSEGPQIICFIVMPWTASGGTNTKFCDSSFKYVLWSGLATGEPFDK